MVPGDIWLLPQMVLCLPECKYKTTTNPLTEGIRSCWYETTTNRMTEGIRSSWYENSTPAE